MPEKFVGSVTIQDTAGSKSQITLDADTSIVTLQEPHGNKTVVLEGNTGRIFLGSVGFDGHLQLRNAKGKGVSSFDANGYVYLGASGNDGNLILRTKSGRETLHLRGGQGHVSAGGNGVSGQIEIRSPKNENIVSFNAKGYAYVGNVGANGTLILRNKHGNHTLSLEGGTGRVFAGGNGSNGHLQLRNAKGQGVTTIDANGNYYSGGEGREGNITLRNKNAKHTLILEGAEGRIFAGGQGHNGYIQVRNSKGQGVINLGGTGKLHVGGKGSAGHVHLHDKKGVETVHIDGEAGDVVLLNADCAEEFDVVVNDAVEPGTVLVIGPDGRMEPCRCAYDKRVAGVVSGAGDRKPGIVLGRKPGQQNRLPIALVGTVYCKVDADCGAIEIGDLLCTSESPGHAMKVRDMARAPGTVIGKALRPLAAGKGMIPILVSLQ